MKALDLFSKPERSPASSASTLSRVQKIGSNRGQPRIWIEGQCLATMGWARGTRYTCEFQNGSIIYRREEGGPRAVAGDDKRPIIDTNNREIHTSLGADAKWISVAITADQITITPTAAPASKLKSIVTAAAFILASIGTPWIAKHDLSPKRVLVACEESATVRDAFNRLGHDAISCDLLPTRNPLGWHLQGDVTPLLEQDWDMIIGFPPCTYFTNSSVWALKDPDFARYPGVGYHQRIKPTTLTGEARRKAQATALTFVQRIWRSCQTVCIENPNGLLSSLFRKPSQIIQPWQFGHPESKTTSLFLKNLPLLTATHILAIEEHGWRTPSGVWRWMNQTSGGQSNLSPTPDRDKIRSTTYAGIGEAMARQWGGDLASA